MAETFIGWIALRRRRRSIAILSAQVNTHVLARPEGEARRGPLRHVGSIVGVPSRAGNVAG